MGLSGISIQNRKDGRRATECSCTIYDVFVRACKGTRGDVSALPTGAVYSASAERPRFGAELQTAHSAVGDRELIDLRQDERTPAQVLADKVELLLDALPGKDGKPMTFPIIQEELTKRGVSISRTRWHYLKTADPRVRADERLLRALAGIFDVDPDFLLREHGELPERIEKELKVLRSMRRAKVRDFAMRALGEIDPEGLQAILDVIEQNENSSPND